VNISWRSIFWSYLRLGAGAFGGGMAALPVFEAELVTRRRWLSAAEVAEIYVISQSIPGVIIVNFSVLSAMRLSGKRAACLAALAVVLPAFLIILTLAVLFTGRWDNRWVAAALSGLRPAVVAIVAGAAIRLAKAHLNRIWMGLAAALGAGLMFFQILGPVPLILLGALIGLVCHALNQRERAA
jgi:chromate transporter